MPCREHWGRFELHACADAWRSLTVGRRRDYASRAILFRVGAETPLDAYIDKLETVPINLGRWGIGVPYGPLFMDTYYVRQVIDSKADLEKLQRSSIWHTGDLFKVFCELCGCIHILMFFRLHHLSIHGTLGGDTAIGRFP